MHTLLQLSSLSSQEEYSYFLHEMFQHWHPTDLPLSYHLADFASHNYSIYQVHGTDVYYIDEVPDLIKGYLRRGISWESHIKYLIERFVQPNTIAIDLGGHIGIHTLAMSRCVQEGGQVYVFEPQVKLFVELVINMRLNEASNIQFFRKALGAEVAEVEMEPYFPRNEGGMALGSGGERVQRVPLDQFSLNHVSFIKIDVEGSEEQVIEGARQTILRNRPVMVVEIMGSVCYEKATPIEKEEIHRRAGIIEALGYRVLPIRGNNYLCLPEDLSRSSTFLTL